MTAQTDLIGQSLQELDTIPNNLPLQRRWCCSLSAPWRPSPTLP